VDDWGVTGAARSISSFWDIGKIYSPLNIYRPLAQPILTFASAAFKTYAPAYIIFHLSFFISAILLSSAVFRKVFGFRFALIFALFAAMPIISSSFIFSPAMQLIAGVSIFGWALSFWLLHNYLERGDKKYLYWSYLVLFLFLLVYEIILPLIVATLFLPIIVYRKRIGIPDKSAWISFWKHVFWLSCILITIFVYQKMIAPHFFGVSYSRFGASLSFGSLLRGAASIQSWLIAMFGDLPRLLYRGIAHFGYPLLARMDWWILLFLIISIFWLISKLPKISDTSIRYVFLFAGAVFLAGASLYFLSGATASLSGYENRGLSSSWFGIALLFAAIGEKLARTKFFVVIPIVLILVVTVFLAQRDAYINSNTLQKEILKDVVEKISRQDGRNNLIVLGNVPWYMKNNFNNEAVFIVSWDFGAAVDMVSGGKIANGNELQIQKIHGGLVKLMDDKIVLDDGWEIGSDKLDKLYYYEFNIQNGESSLIKVDSFKNFQNIVTGIENHPINDIPSKELNTLAGVKIFEKQILTSLGVKRFWQSQ